MGLADEWTGDWERGKIHSTFALFTPCRLDSFCGGRRHMFVLNMWLYVASER
jgi:hypothetical protein